MKKNNVWDQSLKKELVEFLELAELGLQEEIIPDNHLTFATDFHIQISDIFLGLLQSCDQLINTPCSDPENLEDVKVDSVIIKCLQVIDQLVHKFQGYFHENEATGERCLR